jgi:hypothetical protein
MGVQITTPATTLPSLAVQGQVGFFSHALAGQPGPFTLAGFGNQAMALPTAAGVAVTGATNVAAFGYTTAQQANDIVTAINALEGDVATVRQNVNSIIAALQSLGLLS